MRAANARHRCLNPGLKRVRLCQRGEIVLALDDMDFAKVLAHLRAIGIERDRLEVITNPVGASQPAGCVAAIVERAGRIRVVEDASGLAAIDAIHLVTDLVATMLPNMERMGLVKASEVSVPNLAQMILAELGADGTLVGRAEVAAWATV